MGIQTLLKEEFWYESNVHFATVKTFEKLVEICKDQIGPHGAAMKTVDEFLDKSLQNIDGNLDFGTRREHKGAKSLRQYLTQNGDLDKFLEKMKS